MAYPTLNSYLTGGGTTAFNTTTAGSTTPYLTSVSASKTVSPTISFSPASLTSNTSPFPIPTGVQTSTTPYLAPTAPNLSTSTTNPFAPKAPTSGTSVSTGGATATTGAAVGTPRTVTLPSGQTVQIDASGNIIGGAGGSVATGGTGTGTAGTLGGGANIGNQLSNYLSQIEGLTPEQKELLGLGESPEQKQQRDAMTASLERLISLQSELASAGAPSQTLLELDRVIGEQTKALKDLTPGKFLETQPGLLASGINQTALEREVATRREPIAGALSDLLFSRSVLADAQKANIEAIQGRIQGVGSEMELRQAIASLAPKRGLPEGVANEFLKNLISPQKRDTQIVEANGRKLLVDTQTGQTIRDIGSSSDVGTGGSGIISSGGGISASITSLSDINSLPVSDLTKSVMAGYGKIKDLTPTDRAKVQTELYRVGFNPYEYINRKLDSLASSWENAGFFKGILAGRLPFATSLSPEAASFESQKTLLTREVARLFDVGVLSDQDVASYKDAMPSRSDRNIDVVNAKIEGIKQATGGGLATGDSGGGFSGTTSSGLKYTVTY